VFVYTIALTFKTNLGMFSNKKKKALDYLRGTRVFWVETAGSHTAAESCFSHLPSE